MNIRNCAVNCGGYRQPGGGHRLGTHKDSFLRILLLRILQSRNAHTEVLLNCSIRQKQKQKEDFETLISLIVLILQMIDEGKYVLKGDLRVCGLLTAQRIEADSGTIHNLKADSGVIREVVSENIIADEAKATRGIFKTTRSSAFTAVSLDIL